jgi:hypothetical protein
LRSKDDTKAVQILLKFVKEVNQISHFVDEFVAGMGSNDDFMALKNPKTDFIYKIYFLSPENFRNNAQL